jgi:4-hydroxy-tetrahydrodipicolinate reductase
MKKNSRLHIGLIGASGRLGSAIQSLAAQDSTLLLTPYTREQPVKIDPNIDLYLDVSTPLSLPESLAAALKAQKPIVIGVTGHTLSLESAAKSIPIFHAPNFSLGMALMEKCAKLLASNFCADIDLVEAHHKTKKDAPSGSALRLKEAVGKNVTVHSIRAGHIVGHHTLYFNTPEESITLTHEAHSKEVFAKGALAAARFLLGKPPGLYTMESLV